MSSASYVSNEEAVLAALRSERQASLRASLKVTLKRAILSAALGAEDQMSEVDAALGIDRKVLVLELLSETIKEISCDAR